MTLFGALMGFLFFSGNTLTAHAVQVPDDVPLPNYSVTVTAYNAVPAQTDDTPFETASGAYSNPEVVAARSRNLASALPFGTIIEFDGSDIPSNKTCGYSIVEPLIGYRVIADTMNPKFTDRIDVLFDTKADYIGSSGRAVNAAHTLGICEGVTVRVVGFVNINRIPQTQEALAALVARNTTELALR